ncbi:hypothetical protein PCK1_003108 [Pneumocystis canis]|nr:hypothetical protein PCK1_003108 [Pneumocystis canis]
MEQVKTEVDITCDENIKKAKNVIYCGVCSFPPEYCEYGGSINKCMKWLKENHLEMYNQFYSKVETISIDQKNLTIEEIEENEKKQTKEDLKNEKKLKNNISKVFIKRVERNKRKYVISVQGLELFGIDLKKAAKLFGKKFATGSSVTKNASGFDELVVQGDHIDEIYNYIIETYPEIPEDSIDCVRNKQNKR